MCISAITNNHCLFFQVWEGSPAKFVRKVQTSDLQAIAQQQERLRSLADKHMEEHDNPTEYLEMRYASVRVCTHMTSRMTSMGKTSVVAIRSAPRMTPLFLFTSLFSFAHSSADVLLLSGMWRPAPMSPMFLTLCMKN